MEIPCKGNQILVNGIASTQSHTMRSADPKLQTPGPAVSGFAGTVVTVIGASVAGLGALWFAIADFAGADFCKRWFEVAPWLVFLWMPGCLALILFLRDRVFPGTDGTGIPQTIVALQSGPGPLREKLLSPRVAIGKVLLTSIGLASGLSIGREGPSVQLGACIMHGVTRFARFPAHLVERGLILAGGAAGIAAAFNAPIAGIIFAFEEIGRSFDKHNLGTIVRTVLIACIVCMAAMGNTWFYGDLAASRTVLSEFSSALPWTAVILVGIVGGALGGGFSRLLLGIIPHVTRAIRWRFWVVAIVIGLASAALAWISNGMTLNGGRDQAAAILAANDPVYLDSITPEARERVFETDAKCGVMYPVLRAAASMLALCTGIPGGLFDPSFSVGAGLGKSLAPYLSWTGATPLAVALLFMVAWFSGVVQSPITSCVVLIEMSGFLGAVLPLLTASIIAYEVSRRICPVALYEALAQNFQRREQSQ